MSWGIALAIGALVGVVAGLVTLIRTDAEKNPDRDWHSEGYGEDR